MANPTLNVAINKSRGSVDFGRLIPMTGNTYAVNFTGGDAGDSFTMYVMDEEQKVCLANSTTTSGSTTIAFNTDVLRGEFSKEWHEIRTFHTLISDGTNTIAEGDLSIGWNPGWTDATTGNVYSMKGPKGDTGPGITNIEFLNYDVSGNSVYKFTIADGNTFNVVFRRGETGVGIVRVDANGYDVSGNSKYNIVLSNGSTYGIICPKGPQGRGISTIALNDNGTLTFTYTDGTTWTSPSVRGPQGPQGPQGKTGDGSYVFDPLDGKWHNMTVYTDEFGEKVVNVNPVGVNVRPGSDGNTIDDHLDTTSTNPVQNKKIAELIPEQATSENQLADKGFVNSSIATNTANYISDGGQPFQSLAALQAYTGTKTNNDYAFVVGTDAHGNTTYTRYKWAYSSITSEWAWSEEYVLNNSSFTAAQWAAISSGITSAKVTKLDGLPEFTSVTMNGVAVSVVDNVLPLTSLKGTDETNSNATITDIKVVSQMPQSPNANTIYLVKE